ncbi:MAG: carbohydrate ABC transporter permease, partial [Streptomycetaceae bacterium]|nr:carbohydrate ABC transporter permease [Streptomycetaceae bacterium]
MSVDASTRMPEARSRPRKAIRPLSRRPRRRAKSTALTVAMGLMLVYTLIPLVWLFISATKSNRTLFDSPGLWFGDGF